MIRIPAAAALLAVLALTACAPGPAAPSPASTSTATAVADDPDVPDGEPAVDAPSARFGDGCAALVPDALLAPILPFAFASNDLLRTEYLATPSIPRHAAVAQLGGMLCEWSNGEGYSSQTGSSAFRGLQLAILPEASDGWATFAEYYGLGSADESVSCFADAGLCSFDATAAGFWFSGDITTTVGGATTAAVQALVDHLQAQAAGFGTLDPAWTAAGARSLSADCAAVLPSSIVTAIFGSTELWESDHHAGGWSLWAEAYTRLGDYGCAWWGDVDGVAVSSQTGGAWLAEHLGATTNGTAVDIPGLDGGVARLTTHADGSAQIDLVAHGTWVTTQVWGSADPVAGVRLLADHVAGRFTP